MKLQSENNLVFGILLCRVKSENKKQKQQIYTSPLWVPVSVNMQAIHETNFSYYGGGLEFDLPLSP